MPEELYISGQFQTGFDETGTIQELDTLIYGKDKNGQTNTYLIDYDADDGETMTVWTDQNTDAAYDSDKLLSPMLEILKKTDCESTAADLASIGYGTHAVHNNGGNFYSRVNAFP